MGEELSSQNTRFRDWLARKMQDPEYRRASEALELGYQVASLRTRRGLTQGELAGLVGTTQSSIARLESSGRLPSLSFLKRVVEALGGRVVVKIEAAEDVDGQRASPDGGPGVGGV